MKLFEKQSKKPRQTRSAFSILWAPDAHSIGNRHDTTRTGVAWKRVDRRARGHPVYFLGGWVINVATGHSNPHTAGGQYIV